MLGVYEKLSGLSSLKGQFHGKAHAHLLNYFVPIYY